MQTGNFFSDIPAQLPEELVNELVGRDGIRVERIVSKGHASPDDFWYDQAENEWVMVLKGEARLRIEGRAEPLDLKTGDYINLPAHCKHRVEWTKEGEETIWLAVFY
ncbi:cupin domain-containing protein [Larkinella bovis]|uniref:Cupin domain-containing protein n=1 Tax=Larkinella bovis TaxID=683041 RepID=A0ABW0IK97_9BACT